MRSVAFVLRVASLSWAKQLGRARALAGKSVPVAGALALFFAYPSIIGYQDAAALLAPGAVNAQDRWLANVVQKPGSSVLAAGMNGQETAELDPIVTGSVSAEPLSARIATSREPQRINRTAKGDRVVTSTYVQPPKGFNAGAVMERQSFLSPVAPKTAFNLAFAKPMPFGDAIKVASAFTRPVPKEPEVGKDLPVMVAKLVVESAPNVLAYGAESEVVASPFAVVLKSDEPVNLIPRLDDKDHSWAAEPLPISVFSDREQHCLTAGIYFEARGEPVRGQAAVAQVILNRVKNPTYPNSICGVVYQNKDWRNRCQFSFACDKIKDKVQDPKRWRLASYVARETTHGRIWLAEVGSSTHYHATYVKPRWARAMEKVGRIGLHVFYRTFGGGWS